MALTVRHPGDGEPVATMRAIPTMAASLRNWVVVLSVALFVGFTALFWALTGSLLAAVGIAGFATVWGGVGFGVMAAGAAQAMRDERATRAGPRR
jgi:hypothetical protein